MNVQAIQSSLSRYMNIVQIAAQSMGEVIWEELGIHTKIRHCDKQ